MQRALERAQTEADPVDAAASLLYEIVAAQAFFEGNKRTAVIVVRWFIRQNTDVDPDQLIGPDDRELGTLLINTARGDRNEAAIQGLLRTRADTTPG